MAITIDDTVPRSGGFGTSALADRLIRRVRVLARLSQIRRARRRALRLMLAEMRDPRWLVDVGVEANDPRGEALRLLALSMKARGHD